MNILRTSRLRNKISFDALVLIKTDLFVIVGLPATIVCIFNSKHRN